MDRISIQSIIKKTREKRKITMLTAYDYTMAVLLDQADIDIILVGDSLGMVFSGEENTLQVTLDQMLYHTRAVARGVKRSLIVGDMPFGSFQVSSGKGFHNAAQFLRAGAQAVKIEGGSEMAPTVEYLVKRGIPVMGHIGLQPQSVHAYGGYFVQGKKEEQAEKLKNDALALEQAGAFSVVLEAIPGGLARDITSELSIPSIGIGAGKYCDGQVLVINDMLGLNTGKVPRFVKQYADLKKQIKKALQMYCKEVQEGSFPEDKNTYE